MIRILLALLLVFSFIQTSFAYVSDEQGTAIFKDIIKQAEKSYGAIPPIGLYYDVSSIFPNAYIGDLESCPGIQKEIVCIVIVHKWMQHLTPGQFAAIVGHEVGHFEHGDLFGTALDSQRKEHMADEFGIWIANLAGYNGCEVAQVWKQFAGKDHSLKGPGTHPTPWSRYLATSKQCGLPV